MAPQHVFVPLGGDDADAVLRDLVGKLTAAPGAPAAPGLLDALLAREHLGSTAVGGGVAIPHAKVPGLKNPLLAIGLTRRPIDFGAPDREPVRLLFLLLSPAESPAEHLRMLSLLSRWLAAAPSRAAALQAAESRARVLDILREDAA